MILEQEVGKGPVKDFEKGKTMLQRKEELGYFITSGRTKELGKF